MLAKLLLSPLLEGRVTLAVFRVGLDVIVV